MSEATIKPDDIRWRVGQISKKDPHKGSLLGYIDARTCMEALDALDPEWSAVHGDPIIVGGELVGVPCTVTVNGVRRSDVGMPSSQEPIKGAYSDALKRAAVHFGIGRELYELPRIYVKLDEYKKPVATPTYRNGRWTLPSGTGSVFYDREPDEQPQGGEREASTGKREQPAKTHPAVPNQYRRGELAELMKAHNLDLNAVEAFSVAVGISRDERPMSDESMDKLIDAIRESVALDTSAAARAADQDGAPLPSEELSDASGIVPDPAGAPPVPPELQERIDKARSRGKKADEPVQESLLGEPVA